MCGIFGYVGIPDRLNTLINGLKSLEYRGYDSAGVAYFKKNKIKLIKAVGNISSLKSKVNPEERFALGIAHTRWATHGLSTENNAHPHISYSGGVGIVHNGIIENYQYLKEKYLKNIELKSETDTEIIVHLLQKFMQKNFKKTIKKVCNLIKGSYAFAIIKRGENKIFLTKKSSPLMFGKNKNGYYFSSDVNSLGLFCNQWFMLNDQEICVLSAKNFQIYNQNLQKVKRAANKTENVLQFIEQTGCFMQLEISEAAKSIKNTAKIFKEQFEKIPKNFWQNIERAYFIGCGTAYHSCLIGEKILKSVLKIPINVEIASEFVYGDNFVNEKTLCVFVSQSGETADTLLALKIASGGGAKTLAITNNKTSSLKFASSQCLVSDAGWERAVASTKAYLCQIAIFHLLSGALRGADLQSEINNLAEVIQKFEYQNWVDKIVEMIPKYQKIIFIGRQESYVTAMEASLKLKEITYINCIAVASGELKHGTLALVDQNTLVIAILNEDNLINKNNNTIKEITARKGKVVVVSKIKELASGPADLLLPDNKIMPILSIIPLQKVACDLSLKFGINPDMPKNLSKSVTVE